MNINQIRNETPHCRDKYFLNSAGASLMPQVVTNSIIEYLREEEKIGGYRVEELKQEELNEFYKEAAQLINCKPRNISFANNATDAFGRALSSIDFKKDDVIITSDDDYVSNYMNFISLKNRFGIKIVRIKNLEDGTLNIQDFEKLTDLHNPKIVSISHIPTNSGLIQNVEKVGEICNDRGIIFILDACQSVGQIDVDVQKIKCDFLSATGRKFLRGPRGTGFLYVSDRLLKKGYSPLYVDLGGATWTDIENYEVIDTAKRFETWEKPCSLVVGLKEAIKYANSIGIDQIEAYNQNLVNHLRENLSAIPGITIFDKGKKLGNICTFRIGKKSQSNICTHLDKNNIYYSVVDRGSALIDFDKKGVEWVIRFSPHYFNTMEEMNKVCEIVSEL